MTPTPKEKANDIWMKLFQKQIEVTGSGDGDLCVELALIAVDELIKYTHSDKRANSPMDKEYWQKVKHEIERL